VRLAGGLMRRAALSGAIGLGLVIVIVIVAWGREARLASGRAPAPAGASGSFAAVVAPVLRRHCVHCHGPQKQKGDLRLDTIDGDLVHGRDGEAWREIYARLNRGEMPPDSEPRLADAEIDQVVSWIAAETRAADRRATGEGGRTIMRRLNRAEYANTVRDLLDVEFPYGDGPMDLLPPDGTAGGFDDIGSALTLDPSLLDHDLIAARRVADTAIVRGPRPFETRRSHFDYADTAKSSAIAYECTYPNMKCRAHDFLLMDSAARTWTHLRLFPGHEETIPIDGRYTIRVRMGADLGRRGEPLKVELVWPEETVIARWTLTRADAAPRTYEVTLPVKLSGKNADGPQIRLVNGTRFSIPIYNKDRSIGWAPNPEVSDLATVPKVILDWIEIEGPLVPEWPPRSHRDLFFEGPGAKQDIPYAWRIFRRLMGRAYRRPVTDDDVRPAVSRVERELRAGQPFEEAVKVGLEYVLCSPQFLFLVEPSAVGSAGPRPAPPRPVTDFELATRLSYFLWSSMPDDALERRAAAGTLRSPPVLAAEVTRMLRDPKARALVDGFGAEWLQASRFVGSPPNRRIYQDWTDELESAVKREPLAFFDEVLRHDLSALNFLASDFAMLNGPLARHYGIAGVEGEAFRRVALPADAHRGGLLTQAAILTIGSDGTRTMPVRRASWVLDTFFNAPPNPPPPNVRELEATTGGGHHSVRARLLQHQQVPACASCHRGIDPYGLALENFDAVGAWRERQNGEDFGAGDAGAPAIDASGTLPDGRRFGTFAEFRALLAADRARFGRAFTEKMLSYALGRTVGIDDADAVGSVAAAFARGDYRMSALIAAIATSEPFLTK
jgi:mono/diheme cytochrome c family protein